MERYRFGKGDYKIFSLSAADVVESLRTATYPHLAQIANRWSSDLGSAEKPFPLDHKEFLKRCHHAGQKQATPLLLHYEAGGYNCLHQDLYGEIAFPLQLVIMLGQQEEIGRAANLSSLKMFRARNLAQKSSPPIRVTASSSQPAIVP